MKVCKKCHREKPICDNCSNVIAPFKHNPELFGTATKYLMRKTK